MRKLLTTLLLAILVATNAQLAFAADDDPSRRDLIRACKADLGCSDLETFSEISSCRAKCRDNADETLTVTPVGEVGAPGEVKDTILPPIEKPAFLPGPNIDDNTGEAVNKYVTQKFLPAIAKRLTTIVAVLSLLGLVYAGILFFTAAGTTERIDKAKKAAMYSIIGLVISLLSFTIVQIVNLLPLG